MPASQAGERTLAQHRSMEYGPHIRKSHVNFLELLAILKTLKAFCYIIQGNAIQIATNNTTALHYITRSKSLLYIAILIWEWCYNHHVFPVAVHIGTQDNYVANALSCRGHANHEWCLDERMFLSTCDRWGTPHMDGFGIPRNAKCTMFCTGAGVGVRIPGRCLPGSLVNQPSLPVSTLVSGTENSAQNQGRRGRHDPHCPTMATSTMVYHFPQNGIRLLDSTIFPKSSHTTERPSPPPRSRISPPAFFVNLSSYVECHLHVLDVRRALSFYISQMSSFRTSSSSVCILLARVHQHPLSQSLNGLKKTIVLSYVIVKKPLPLLIRSHSTRTLATSTTFL